MASLSATLDYKKGYPPVVNTADGAARAIMAATSMLGSDNVDTEFSPSLGCEDFAYMIREVGGCYAWVGAGVVGPGEGLHGDRFVFNDEIVPTVLRYYVRLVEDALPRQAKEAAA